MCQSLLKIGTLLHKLGFVKTGVASTVNKKWLTVMGISVLTRLSLRSKIELFNRVWQILMCCNNLCSLYSIRNIVELTNEALHNACNSKDGLVTGHQSSES